jgi:hypothetical protein
LSVLTLLLLLLGLGQSAFAAARPYPPGFNPDQVPSAAQEAAPAAIEYATGLSLPFSDTVEGGTNGWVADGFWHRIVNPQMIRVATKIRTDLVQLPDSGFLPTAYSGTACWWFGENATGTFIGSDYNTTQGANSGGTSTSAKSGNLVSPLINLTGVSQASLSFYTWWEIEGVDVHAYDMMYVDVTTDGGATWTNLGKLNPIDDANTASYIPYSTNGVNQTGQWGKVFFNLTPYIGNQIKLRFRFNTIDSLYNGFRGWLVDNISVSATAPPTLNVTGVSPAIASPGQLVAINGSGFLSGATVKVGSTTAESAEIFHNKIIAYVPYLTNGTYTVTVTNPGGASDSLVSALTVSTATPPAVSGVSPNLIDCSTSATQFTINGSNFQPGITVKLDGTTLSGLTYVSTTQIKASKPASLGVGTHNITVTNSNGLSYTKFGAVEVYGNGKITGKIYKSGTTTGLGSAQIVFTGPVKGTVYSNSTGAYSIDGLVNGSYTIKVSKTGYATKSVSATISSCGSLAKTIYLTPATTGTLTGRVTKAAGGAAIAGATVTLSPGGASRTTDTNGYYTFNSLATGTYSVTAAKTGYVSKTTSGAAVTAGTTKTVNFALNTTVLKGRVTNAATAAGISGATVTLSPGGASRTTDANGYYTFNNVAAGTYSVTAAKTGYVSKTTSGVAVTAGATKTVNFALNASSGTGSVTGKITNAVTGLAISGATVKLGTTTKTTATDGTYSFTGVTAGGYTLTVSKSGFVTTSQSVTVASGTTKTVHVALSPVDSSIKYRVVLSWGSAPYDLDSHLWVPNGSGYGHVYWASKGSSTAFPYAELDVDDTSSYGPETITIHQNQTGVYQYWVYNYSGTPDITTSAAVVKLYNGSTLLKTYYIPTSPSGNRAWHVFDLNAKTGVRTDVNTLAAGLPSLSPAASASLVEGTESKGK